MKDKAQAQDLVLTLDLLERRGVARSPVIAALRQSGKVTDTIRRWSYRMQFPRGPIPHGDCYAPINNGLELISAAKKFRNCSRRYFNSLTSGEHAFGVFRHKDESVMLSFDRSQGYWVIAGAYGYNNRPLTADVSQAGYAFAARHGVLDRGVRERGDKALEAMRRLSGRQSEWL